MKPVIKKENVTLSFPKHSCGGSESSIMRGQRGVLPLRLGGDADAYADANGSFVYGAVTTRPTLRVGLSKTGARPMTGP